MPSQSQIWLPEVGYIPIYDANRSIVPIRTIAAEGQTIFPLLDIGFKPNTNSIFVYKNRVLQYKDLDYTEGDPRTILLTVPATAGDELIFICFTEVKLTSTIPYEIALRVPFGEGQVDELPSIAERKNRILAFDSFGQPYTVIPDTGTSIELRLDLANSDDPTKGTFLIGYKGETLYDHLEYIDQRLIDLPSEADPAGTAATLVEAHNHDAAAHPELSEFITSEADRAEAAANLAQASSNTVWRKTLAELQAAMASQPANTPGMVTDDGTNNGQYLWDGTTLTKTEFQFADESTINLLSSNLAEVQVEIGPTDVVSSSFGDVSLYSGQSTTEFIRGNAIPLPSSATVDYVDLHFSGAATGELHIISPYEGGGTQTKAIYPVSIEDVGDVRVTVGKVFDAGTWVTYKWLSGFSLAYLAGSPDPIGAVTFLPDESVNVGDIQPAGPGPSPNAQMAMQVYITEAVGTTLYDRVNAIEAESTEAKEAADYAKEKIDLTTSFLGTDDLVWEEVSYGSATLLPQSQVGVNAYGPGELSPGGTLTKISVYYDSGATGTVDILVIDANRVIIAKFTKQVNLPGPLNEWSVANGDFPSIYVPEGGAVLLRRGLDATFGYKYQTVTAGLGNAFSTASYPQVNEIGEVQNFNFASNINVGISVEYQTASRTLEELISGQSSGISSPFLIDERFQEAGDWVLNGATIANGLVSPDSSSWATRCYPADYGFSEIDKRTRTIVGTVNSANQIWGMAWIRESTGTQLNTPAMIVDGVSNSLKIYEFDSNVTTQPELRQEVAIPWTVTGSRVRLTETRIRFATTWTLYNMVTGESVQLELDYAAGSGATGYRPCGRPIVIFPSTVNEGVVVESFQMVADIPFPAGKAARVIFLGDSITENSQNGPEFDLGFGYLIEDQRELLGAKDTVVLARGGQRSEHLANCITELLALCDKNTIVIILIGTNDANQGISQAATRGNIGRIVNALRTKTIRISVACLPPLGATPNPARALLVQDAIDMYYGEDLLPPVRFDLALSLNNDGETRDPAKYKENTHPNNIPGNEDMRQRIILDLPEVLN